MTLPHKIGILGLGLIGGSIAKALKEKMSGIDIASLERNCPDLQEAVSQKVVDHVFPSWKAFLAWSELVIIATPLPTLCPLAIEIARRGHKMLVIDVSSVKKEIVPCFEALTTEDLEFFSTHPMAGKEMQGFKSSQADLFQDCCWILSPHSKNTDKAIKTLQNLIITLGAKPVCISPEKHDRQAALVSHLPALLSRLLMRFVQSTDPESLELAGPGFKSMTRLSRDNPEMQSQIMALNQEEIAKQLTLFLEFIKRETDDR